MSIFIMVLCGILFFFGDNFKKIGIKSKVIDIVKEISNYNEGSYYYKNGVIYDSDNNIKNTDYYIEMQGNFNRDKYGNVEVNISNNEYLVCKPYLGEINVSNECNLKSIEAYLTKNNSLISFTFNNKITSYYMNNEESLSGNFIDVSYEDVLVIGFDRIDNYYIWFKDEYGNISKPLNFDVNCFMGEGSIYNNKTLYCNGSTIIIEDEQWAVISDENKELNIIKVLPLENKLSHYEVETEYRWSTSQINNYLNNGYYNILPSVIKDNLISKEICDSVSGKEGCDSEDGCGGYKKETIEKHNWECESYTNSKVRLISYEEYSSLYKNIYDKKLLSDNFWTMNSSNNSSSALSILDNGEVYVLEESKNKLNIRPVVTISK